MTRARLRTPPAGPSRGLPAARRAALLVFPLGCALAALAIGQDANYDLLNYHYYIAYAFLHARLGIDVYTAQLQSLLNPFLDIPFYVLINHTPPRIEAAVVGALQGLNLVLVYLIGRRVTRSRLLAASAAIAAGVAGGFASELGNSMGDTIVSIPLLAGVLFAVVALGRSEARVAAARGGAPAGATSTSTSPAARPVAGRRPELVWWLVAGAAAGFGAGLKFSGLPIALGVVIAAAAPRARLRERARRLATTTAGLVAGVLVTSGYWSWFLWRNYKDPIAFTQASFGIFHSPYVPQTDLGASRFGPKSLADAVVFPLYWVVHPLRVAEVRLRELSMPIAYALVALLVVAVAARAVARTARAGGRIGASRADVDAGSDADVDRYLVVVFAVSLAVWMEVFDVYRYLVALELLSPLVAFAAARRLVALLPSARPTRARAARALAPGFLAVCVVCASTANPANYWGRAPFGSRYFSLALPGVLANGRVDAVVEVGGQPMGFVFPQLPARVISIGGIGNLLTPDNRALVHRALARVRADRGTVNVAFVDAPVRPGLGVPRGTSRYLARLGARDLVVQVCDVVRAGIGAGYQPVKFCRYGPAGRTG